MTFDDSLEYGRKLQKIRDLVEELFPYAGKHLVITSTSKTSCPCNCGNYINENSFIIRTITE